MLATVWAGTAHLMHGHIEFVALQLFGTTAEREFLIALAKKYGLSITPATFAAGTITVVAPGPTPIPEDTILVRDDGETYIVTALATITGSGPVSVQAQLAGSGGNMEASDILSFESPIAGVESDATVILIEDGLDEEDTEDFRVRYLLRRRSPSRGGSDADYIGWALSVAGVTRAWVARHENGLGTLVVRFVLDGEVDIFPSGGKVAEVQAVFDEKRPATAEPTAASPDPGDANFTISLANDTASIRTAVEAELADLVKRVGEPGDAISKGTIFLSAIRTAIGNVSDGDYTLTSPTADTVPGIGELLTFGSVTWV